MLYGQAAKGRQMPMSKSELHDPNNWLLKSKHKISSLNLAGDLVECYKCIFTCQECGNKYPRLLYSEEEFLQMKVDQTVWAYGWQNG